MVRALTEMKVPGGGTESRRELVDSVWTQAREVPAGIHERLSSLISCLVWWEGMISSLAQF